MDDMMDNILEFNAEDVLREKILAFERKQVRAKLRPPLPCDVKVKTKQDSAIFEQRKVERTRVFNDVIEMMPDNFLFNCEDVAEKLCIEKPSAVTYLKQMVDRGYLHQIPKSHASDMFRFVKTGNTP